MSGPGADVEVRGEPRFFADAMLGRLATWMRILGVDVEYERDIPDSVLVIKALAGGRVILTRDRLLTRRRSIRGRVFYIESDRFIEQLREVVERFRLGRERVFTRCARCNVLLRGVDKGEVKGRVPEYVFDTQESFVGCPECGRVYWAGTHRVHVKRVLDEVFEEKS